MGDRYIVGTIGRLAVSNEEPIVGPWPQAKGKPRVYASFKTEYGNRCHFAVERGKCREFASYSDGQHVYCRLLPLDAEPALQRYDAIIADLERQLAHAKEERQEYLTACVQRATTVRVKK